MSTAMADALATIRQNSDERLERFVGYLFRQGIADKNTLDSCLAEFKRKEVTSDDES